MADSTARDDTEVEGLICSDCQRHYDPGIDEPWRCVCGSALEFDRLEYGIEESPPPEDLDRDRGLWAFQRFLPISSQVTLGEGFTPLVKAPVWDAAFKLEYVFPTGSFKDRGATTTLSRAVEIGVETVVEDSSGNAGAAIATYAARAGIDAKVYVPADAKAAKLRAIREAGAELVTVEGTRKAVTEACIEAVETGEGWYASHAWNPAFYAGTMTFAFEVAAQRDWNTPDAVVLPLGHGTLFLGAYRGFEMLRDLGWIDEMPRLFGAQAAGYAPIATELHGESAETNTLADGIQIREPARGQQILAAIETSGGDAIALGEQPVRNELGRLRRNGFYTEPTCAIAPAALREFRRDGTIADDAEVVVPLTGTGLKSG